MSEPKIPKGFVMIYTETHSICMRIDHIVSVAVACGSNHTLHITTRDGENYKAAYNFEEFLKIMAEEVEVHAKGYRIGQIQVPETLIGKRVEVREK